MVDVLIVDDQPMIRTGLRTILEAQADVDVVGEAGDGLTALALLRETHADVVLMDLRMPGIDGVETTRRLRSAHDADEVRILVLTTFDQDDNVLAALRAGADGFLGKGVGPTELVDAIRQVARGDNALSTAAVNALVGHVADDETTPPDPAAVQLFTALTPRELEVVGAVARGMDNAQIGGALFLSPYTVKTHVNRAMMKVGARDRAQLVVLAFQANIRP